MQTKTLWKPPFNGNAPLGIDEIKIVWQVDTSPDSSDLGTYSNEPAEHSIDRQARGDQKRNEYRYFNLGSGDAEYLELDYKRMEALNRGEWWYMFCKCEAVVSYPNKEGGR